MKKLTHNDVLKLSGILPRLADIRDSKLGYALAKNLKKIEKEREIIVALLKGAKPEDMEVGEFAESNEGRAILLQKNSIELHKIEAMPVVELTANEILVIEEYLLMETKSGDDDGGKPEGHKPPPPTGK